ncbi:MAG: c-type cytochrome biogenesis protein CcmI [Kordiimonas sp.]|nr:c-type cytochrome biogenesis protein CcmI [Kordiimonas sp.]|tara:strand:+ start:2104 stop:3324 length:1221 start_codon:yes stop_codon:yes gene_type:complete
MIWLVLGVMFIGAVSCVLWSVRGHRELDQLEARETDIYRDQLEEVDRDLHQGLIGEAEAAQARIEIKRRLLRAAASDAPAVQTDTEGTLTETKPMVPETKLMAPMGFTILIVFIMLGVSSLYFTLGRPDMTDFRRVGQAEDVAQKRENREAAGSPMPSNEELISRLQDRLARHPEEVKGWVYLGRLQGQIGQHYEAAKAFAVAARLAPEEGDVQVMYAESLMILSGGTISPAIKLVLDRGVQAAPGHPGIEYYLGLAAYQSGDKEAALARWQALLRSAPAEAGWVEQVRRRADNLLRELGRTTNEIEAMSGAAGMAPPLDPEQVDDVSRLSQTEQMNMIRGMVAQLADRLEREPEDMEGWLRLGRAYLVLGEKDKAVKAYERALPLVPEELRGALEKQVDILRGSP